MATTKQCLTPSKGASRLPSNPLSLSPNKGGHTPTKRRPATTPKKRLGNNSSNNIPSLSPPLLRTPPKTICRQGSSNSSTDNISSGCSTQQIISSTYSSDRFIPNRSTLRVDICRASVECAERNLDKTFEKLTKRQAELLGGSGGENGNPNGSSTTPPPVHVPPTTGASPGTTNATSNTGESSTTPLQAEFNRRMRGALLNIPMDDIGSRNIGSTSSVHTVSTNSGDTASHHQSSVTSSPMGGNHNRENVNSIVYASLNNDDSSSSGHISAGSSPLPRRGNMQRMLSFQGTKREEITSVSTSSYRSMSSSSIDDTSTNNNGGGSSTPCSTSPKRRLIRQQSAISSRSLVSPNSPIRRQLSASTSSSNSNRGGNNNVDPFQHDQLHVLHRAASNSQNSHSTSGTSPFDSLSQAENRLRNVTKSIGRRIPKTPSRILDAPELVDDYYLNLVSWSESNVLAVALGQCVYLWEAETGNIKHLLTLREETDFVTSVSWVKDKGNSHYIAVGTNHNIVQLWDAEAERRLRSLDGHSARVGALDWNQHWLSSGGRDSLIVQHDVRSRNHVVSTYVGHTQEVCGLKWNDEGSTLASGGNENLLCLWDASMSHRRGPGTPGYNQNNYDMNNIGPRLALTQHKAAVKALAWCPFHRGLLASGGGTADRTIKFWNTNSGAVLQSIDTGSQVCSLLWSKHQREICSSHGFSENQLILWKYPTMTKIQEFKGHTARVSFVYVVFL